MTYDTPECIRFIQGGAVREHVQAIQAAMRKSAEGCLSESELEHLGAVIRITVELYEYLQLPCTHSFCLTYMSESVFSGIESYCTVTPAYGVLVGAEESHIQWDSLSLSGLRTRFGSMFKEFDEAEAFEIKCRLLLDLYKVLIVFAGISYD